MVAEVMAPPIVSQPASRIPSSAVSRRDPGLQRGDLWWTNIGSDKESLGHGAPTETSVGAQSEQTWSNASRVKRLGGDSCICSGSGRNSND